LQVSRFLLNTVCTNGHWNEQELENVQLDLSCVSKLPAGKAWNDAGNYKQRRAAAKPAACHTHSMHRRPSASYFGIAPMRQLYTRDFSFHAKFSNALFSRPREAKLPSKYRDMDPVFKFWGFCAHHSPTIRVKLARWTKPTISSFLPNFAVIGILCHINKH